MKMPYTVSKIGLLAFTLALTGALEAAPVSREAATATVKGWLRLEAKPLGQSLKSEVERVESFADAEGVDLYHVVTLNGSGFVVVAGDDTVEPIIAFSSRGVFDADPHSPLQAMLSQDLPQRIRVAKEFEATSLPVELQKARAKWGKFKQAQKASMIKASELSVSDVRVDPFIITSWDQMGVSGQSCYNYFTPPNSAGNVANYPCGCVATAMAQVMYYHQYPTRAVGTTAYTVKVNGSTYSYKMRGGNGSGGAYNWGAMLIDPLNQGLTTSAAQAIGALCYDAGVASHMMYTANVSGAYLTDAQKAMVNAFMFSNTVVATYINSVLPESSYSTMINPNLDAQLPVILGINDASRENGHAIVCDGYGYSGGTTYYHMNLGWSGEENAWYALPLIDTSYLSFTVINNCLYNMFPTSKGEILSGRVVDANGNPVNAVKVTAVRSATESYTKTTDSYGIYAFSSIPSASRYTVTVAKDGYVSQSAIFSTTTSVNEALKSGNVWGANFTLQAQAAAAPSFSQSAVKCLGNNQISITFSGSVGTAYRLQESSDFTNWSAVQTVTVTTSPTTVTHTLSSDTAKFFRLVAP
jgi:hypothetical protein